MLDPQRNGGAQSRCRAYIVLVRSDVHKSRGPFAPTSTYRNTAPPATLRSILDPVSKVLPAAADEAHWQPAGIKHKADYRAPKLSHVARVDGHRTMSSFDIDGPSPAFSSDPVYLFDKRPGINRNRLASLDELLRIQGLPPSAVAGLSLDDARVFIGRGTEHTSMHIIGTAIADYPNMIPKSRSAQVGGSSRTSKHRKSASTHLKQCRNNFFPGTSVKIASGRLGFPTSDTMRILGFTVPSNFFSAIAALSRARYKPREHTKRIPQAGLVVTDFKGRFTPSKAGGYTTASSHSSCAGVWLRQSILSSSSACGHCVQKAFDQFKNHMRVKFQVKVTHMLFDRDPSFNRDFAAHLEKHDVDPGMSGANDHWELGAIETYWNTWSSRLPWLQVSCSTQTSTRLTGCSLQTWRNTS
jgi:hypothetical protein